MDQIKKLLEAMQVATIGLDEAGVVRSSNRHGELLFGYDHNGLLGQPIETLMPGALLPVQTIFGQGDPSGLLADAMPHDLELSGRQRDGTELPLAISLTRMSTADGMFVIANVQDLAARRKTEEVVLSTSQLAAIVRHSEDAIVGKSLDGTISSWNPAAERLYGYSSDEVVGSSCLILSPEDKAGEVMAILDKIRNGERIRHFETEHVRKDGTTFPVSLTVSPVREQDGAVVGASAISHDVTTQKQAFESARSMIESSLDSLVSISPEGKITDVNEATVKITGAPRETMIGTAFSDYFTDPDKANEIYQRVFAEGMAVDYPLTMRHREGTLTNVLYNASVYRDAFGNVLGVFAAARNVTKQMQAFEAARSMIESSLDSLVSISPEGKITDVNEATVKITGASRDALIGTDFSDYFTDPDKANQIYQQVFAEGMAVDYALTMRHRDGTLTDVLYNASVYRDAGGRVLGVFAAARDVSKQMQAQYARSLIEAGLDPLVTISPEGKITDLNEATVKVTGVSRESLIGTDFSDYFTDPDRASEGYQHVFAEGAVTDYPLTMRHRDGKLTEVLYNAAVYRDASGAVLGVFAAARDVTERMQAQAAIAQQAKELDRLAELERFQRLTVGRELKMIELKKEIEFLRKFRPADGDGIDDDH